jgi:hypothetical protein
MTTHLKAFVLAVAMIVVVAAASAPAEAVQTGFYCTVISDGVGGDTGVRYCEPMPSLRDVYREYMPRYLQPEGGY